MSSIHLFRIGKNNQLIDKNGKTQVPPAGWSFLPSGDAAITRKVTAKGEVWRVQKKVGKRWMSQGIWALTENIKAAKKEVEIMRADPAYEKKKASAAKFREKKQNEYIEEFEIAVLNYLGFHRIHKMLAIKMASLITAHATPVGSGTVARTKLIPLEQRAAKAVIAWMRHQTTNYDNMQITPIRGERRMIRRKLAQGSLELLDNYRKGLPIASDCPLYDALV